LVPVGLQEDFRKATLSCFETRIISNSSDRGSFLPNQVAMLIFVTIVPRVGHFWKTIQKFYPKLTFAWQVSAGPSGDAPEPDIAPLPRQPCPAPLPNLGAQSSFHNLCHNSATLGK